MIRVAVPQFQQPLGQPFDLRPGASAAVEGGLKVTFERVPSDSRCPMDALCIAPARRNAAADNKGSRFRVLG